MNIFEKRVNLKPYEYPELLKYVDAIRHSYWLHTEFNFTSDIQDFKTSLSDSEIEAIERTMLAIAQIEVSVKMFWADIYNHIPKPEIGIVWVSFAESEARHMDAYSHLLEILGLNEKFESIGNIPAIIDRIAYLQKATEWVKSWDKKEYIKSVLLFSLFVEHVSLFSQFLIIMSFNKHKNVLKGISNVVEATSKEEQLHGDFGIEIINIIKEENPEWFDESFEKEIYTLIDKAYRAENKIVDWIFEKGELDFCNKKVISAFISDRFNKSLSSIWMKPCFSVKEEELIETEWFDDEIMATKHWDFFVKRSVNYNKKSKSITEDDLF